MDDNNRTSEFAWDNTNLANTFSKNRPQDPVPLPVDTNRINTGAYLASARITELTNQHDKATLIFKLLRLYLTTPQFNKIKEQSRQGYLNAIHYFVTWLNTKDNVSNTVVKDFETEQVNHKKIKPESTGATEILFCMKHALAKSSLAGSDLKFISAVINKSNLIPNSNVSTKQATLTGYFLEHSWIESEIGNKQFLKLASPKRLIESFRIVVSESLFYLKKFGELLKQSSDFNNLVLNNSDDIYTQRNELADLISKKVVLDDLKRPADIFSNILLIDGTRVKFEAQILNNLSKGKPAPVKSIIKTQVFINNSFGEVISELEQLLMAFLCASYCVQPEDIFKLRKKHFAVARNTRNEPRNISINYFKGRSGGNHDTPVISMRHSAGRAIYQYLDSIPENQEHLFSQKLDRVKFSTYSIHSVKNDNSISGFLVRLWRSNHFRSQVIPVLNTEGKSTLFLDCISAISSPKAIPFSTWKKKNMGLYEDYINSSVFTQPVYLFWLAHIKNSAVHANSDKYRDGDIKNFNSHTSLTEKTNYLGSDNPEFVNQAGRISRAVLQDIESSVYQPNLDKLQSKIHDKNIRSHLVKITENDDLSVKAIAQEDNTYVSSEFDFDDIRIIESKETVVQMLHYIAQADKYSEQLKKMNPDFFYFTVLVNVEWHKYVLSELFSPKSDAFIQGKSTYENIKKHLPDLFTNELYGGIG